MAGRPDKFQPLADFVLGLDQRDEEEREDPGLILTDRRLEAMDKWSQDPWSFLTGKDPDTGEAIIKTIDQRDKKTPVKPFPAHLEHLHYLIDLLHSEPYLIGEKSSQVMFSTTVLLYDAWACAFKDGWKVLLSKHSEEEAEILLAEKIRSPFSMMPRWLQRQIPVSKKPKNTVIFKKPVESLVLGLPENAAAAKARGQTYQAGRIDEAEFQAMLRELITAMLPRCGQLVFWSTPSSGGEGVHVFRSYLADDPIRFSPNLVSLRKKYAHLKGISTRRNKERDFTIVRVHYSADPAKTKQWAEEGRRKHTSRSDWDREMEIDRRSSAGRPFHPQFAEYPKRYIAKCHAIPKTMPILRGWDFGGNNPACVWGLWSPKRKLFWAVRELLGYGCDTYQFRDLVRYISGQVSLDILQQHPRAMELLEDLQAERAYPPPPWFEAPHRFYDFAGHEAVMGGRGLQKQGDAKTATEILALEDVYLYSRYTPTSLRTELINGLSRLRECTYAEHQNCEGHTGLLLDPACALLIRGLSSGIVYAKATPQNPDPNEPAKDPIYSHIYESFGYILRNVMSVEDANYFQSSFGAEGEVAMPPPQEGQIQSYLTEGLAL